MSRGLKYPDLWPEGHIPSRKKSAMYRTRKRRRNTEIHEKQRAAAPKIPAGRGKGAPKTRRLKRGRNPLA